MSSTEPQVRRRPGRPRLDAPAISDEAVLAAAKQMMVRHGYNATTLLAIADACGVSRPLLNYRFLGGKPALYNEIVRLDPAAGEAIHRAAMEHDRECAGRDLAELHAHNAKRPRAHTRGGAARRRVVTAQWTGPAGAAELSR